MRFPHTRTAITPDVVPVEIPVQSPTRVQVDSRLLAPSVFVSCSSTLRLCFRRNSGTSWRIHSGSSPMKYYLRKCSSKALGMFRLVGAVGIENNPGRSLKELEEMQRSVRS